MTHVVGLPASRRLHAATRLTAESVTEVLLLLWWLVQMGQQILVRPDTVGPATATDVAAAVQSGSALNTLLVVWFGALGAWHLRRAERALRGRAARALLALLGAYVAWAFISLLWSVDPSLTIRRLLQFFLLAIGGIGLGAGLYAGTDGPRRLTRDVLIAAAIAIGVLWLGIASSGSAADVLSPTYAAKFVLGTTVAHPIAYALFALIYRWRAGVQRASTVIVYVLACAATLFVQKVRFITAYSAALLVVVLLSGMPKRQFVPWAVAAVLLIGGVGEYLSVAGSYQLEPLGAAAWDYATVGASGQDLQDLSGRTELWNLLTGYISQRPWVGYGYGAFWNPNSLEQVQAVIWWAPVVAHNGYIDELLGTGAIGLALALAFWVLGVALALVYAFRGSGFALLVACWFALFLLLNWGDSLFEDYFRFPFYASVTALFTLLATTTPVAANRQRRAPRAMRVARATWPPERQHLVTSEARTRPARYPLHD